jgi:trypsin
MAPKLMIAIAFALPMALAAPQSSVTVTRSSDIIGGTNATAADFPSIVAITYEDAKGVVSCGGSLGNENTIITAAHCSTGEVAKYNVRAGSLVCFSHSRC